MQVFSSLIVCSSLQSRSWVKSSRCFLSKRWLNTFCDSKIEAEPGHVYFVATPIGNLNDISQRSHSILASADVIGAEDTRETMKLLNALGFKPKKLISHHQHNFAEATTQLINFAREGKSVAIVSDAGTPGISDPGEEFATLCHRENIPIHPVPGASAVISALSISGFPAIPFSFLGFVPPSGSTRKDFLRHLGSIEHTVVCFETPHRLLRLLEDLCAEGMNVREMLLAKEITKLHEECIRGNISSFIPKILDMEQDLGRVKGEYTLVLGPWNKNSTSCQMQNEEDSIRVHLHKFHADGISRSEAVKLTNDIVCGGKSKSKVYKTALTIDWSEDTN